MRKLWIGFAAVVLASFAALIWVGTEIYQKQPPIPDRVLIRETGEVLFDKTTIEQGQNVWESIGGMEVGSIWGHGSYVAPDWTADWIHREAEFLLNHWAERAYKMSFDSLGIENKGALQARLVAAIRTNTFDPKTRVLWLSKDRALAIAKNTAYYSTLFSKGHEQYAIPEGALTDREKLRKLNAFLFWTSWAASTNRPDKAYTYTSICNI